MDTNKIICRQEPEYIPEHLCSFECYHICSCGRNSYCKDYPELIDSCDGKWHLHDNELICDQCMTEIQREKRIDAFRNILIIASIIFFMWGCVLFSFTKMIGA